MRASLALLLAALVTLGAVQLLGEDTTPESPGPAPIAQQITGPMAQLLRASTDLGPSPQAAQLTAELADAARPDRLNRWAARHRLAVRWQPGNAWAVLAGSARDLGAAFGVAVHDYRGRRGQVFYAAARQPEIPSGLHHEIRGLGRILGYTPFHESAPGMFPADVPDQGLTPAGLRRTYNVGPLTDAGYTGAGQTVVVFAFDGFDQADLDSFATAFGLPPLVPTVFGELPAERSGEATMDLEMVHAIAPDARKVLVNARPTVAGDGAYEKIGALMDAVHRQFPGAVWSFSIGWGCDRLLTAADLAPVRAALGRAQAAGTTAFNASGDLAGLECKGGQDWSAPPGPEDVGLDAVASLPEMTVVGGTTLSTDQRGGWLAEQAWFDVPLSQGTGGGVSNLFDRPAWQREVAPDRAGRRLSPDVSAVADSFTGVRIVFDQQNLVGGGTSMSAPIWAGLAAVLNQYLLDHRGRRLGEFNALLYAAARSAPQAFRDITLGGNAVESAGPGYDLVTGLGTPDVDQLARALLVVQAALR